MSPEEFAAVSDQWNSQEERRMKADWEQARLIGFLSILPYSGKRIKEPRDLFQFAWETEEKKVNNEKPEVPTLEDFERVEAYYGQES